MKIAEIISRVNNLTPNHYSDDMKISWLSNLDGQIFLELIVNFQPECCRVYTPHTGLEDELIIPFPYSEEVYVNFLQAMINKENGETERYNQSIAAYSAAYDKYQSWYIRNHRPKGTGPFRF